jgi:fibronectin type 3 domain-containing protein
MQLHIVERLRPRADVISFLVFLLAIGVLVAGCGGGGGSGGSTGPSPGIELSSQTVRGVAATGSPLVGQVTLRDSSSTRKDKVTVIADDGSFSIDVSDMQAPFLLKATGTADGARHVLYSFADRPGTANINPLTNAALAHAAGVDDPSVLFDRPDPAALERIGSRMPDSVVTLRTKIMPLLAAFDVGDRDPHKQFFAADHDGLDGMFDNVRIVLSGGVLTITNATSGAVIFTAQVRDLEHGQFTDQEDHLPKRGPRLAAPTGVKAVGGDGQVTISWNPVANATSYDLFYRTQASIAARAHDDDDDEGEDERRSDAGTGKWIKNVTSPYVLTGLAANTTYVFMVRARDNPRRGPPSAMVTATTTGAGPAPTVPAAPAAVTATGGTKQVTVSWPAVTGATSYNIYWSSTSGVTTANGTKVSGATSPAVLTGLADSTTYFIIVTAVNGVGESAASTQVAATTLAVTPPPATPPTAPTGVSATGGNEQVTVSWPALNGATSYNVYWSTTPGVTTATGTRIAGVTSPFVHTGRTASTAYFYVVTAVNSAGESSAASQVSATTNAPPIAVPAAPTGVVAVGGTKVVTISWNAVSGATSYNVYWSTTPGVTVATGTKIAGVTSPFPHTGRADGTAYFYVVTAVNSAGESGASAQVTATTSPAPPPVIDGAALYNSFCSGCHGSLASSEKRGATAARITNAISGNDGGMGTRFNPNTGTVAKLTTEQIAAIAAALQ